MIRNERAPFCWLRNVSPFEGEEEEEPEEEKKRNGDSRTNDRWNLIPSFPDPRDNLSERLKISGNTAVSGPDESL